MNLLHLIWVYGHFGTISIYGKSWEIDIGSNQQNGARTHQSTTDCKCAWYFSYSEQQPPTKDTHWYYYGKVHMSMKILRIAAETKRYLNSFSWICLGSYGRNLALLGWFIPLLSRYLWGFIVIPATAGRWGASSDAAAHGIYIQPGSASACRDHTKAPNLNLLGNKNKLLLQRIYIYMCIHYIYMCVYVYLELGWMIKILKVNLKVKT